MTRSFTEHIVVPVADVSDARETAAVLEHYQFDHVTVVHPVEKGDGTPDKIPLEQAGSRAEDAFTAFRETVPDADQELTYARNAVDAIIDVAADVGARAIAFRLRGGSRIVQFLSGNKALRLITGSDRPVIAPQEEILDDG